MSLAVGVLGGSKVKDRDKGERGDCGGDVAVLRTTSTRGQDAADVFAVRKMGSILLSDRHGDGGRFVSVGFCGEDSVGDDNCSGGGRLAFGKRYTSARGIVGDI